MSTDYSSDLDSRSYFYKPKFSKISQDQVPIRLDKLNLIAHSKNEVPLKIKKKKNKENQTYKVWDIKRSKLNHFI